MNKSMMGSSSSDYQDIDGLKDEIAERVLTDPRIEGVAETVLNEVLDAQGWDLGDIIDELHVEVHDMMNDAVVRVAYDLLRMIREEM